MWCASLPDRMVPRVPRLNRADRREIFGCSRGERGGEPVELRPAPAGCRAAATRSAMTAKASSRPSAVRRRSPASALTPLSVPVLARTSAGAPAAAVPRVKRSSRVPEKPATGSPVSSGRSAGCRPAPRRREQPGQRVGRHASSAGQPAAVEQGARRRSGPPSSASTASTAAAAAGERRRLPGRARPGGPAPRPGRCRCRQGLLDQLGDRRRADRGEPARPRRRPPPGDRARRQPARAQQPGERPAGRQRRVGDPGAAAPGAPGPVHRSALTGATTPRRDVGAAASPGETGGPVEQRVVHAHARPARRPWPAAPRGLRRARSARRAGAGIAPRAGRAGGSVGSPPPTSTTSPAAAPATTRVVSRCSPAERRRAPRPRSRAWPSRPGCARPAPRLSNSTSPVAASTTDGAGRGAERGCREQPGRGAAPAAACAGSGAGRRARTGPAGDGGGRRRRGLGLGVGRARRGRAGHPAGRCARAPHDAGGDEHGGSTLATSSTDGPPAAVALHRTSIRRRHPAYARLASVGPGDRGGRRSVAHWRRRGVRRHHRDPQGAAQQVRGRPRDRADPAGPHAVHLHPLPGRLRLHRGHPRRGRRPARRAGAARRADLPRLPDPVPRDRHVPDDRRGRRRRQGAVRAGDRPAAGAPAGHPPRARSSTGWRSSTSSRSTRTSSPASPSRARPGSGRAEAEAEIVASRERLQAAKADGTAGTHDSEIPDRPTH